MQKINKDIDIELTRSELQLFLPTYKITIKGSVVYFSDVEGFELGCLLS